MRLDADEFIRRFLLHVLPRGFTRLRHYGLLANRSRTRKLALCRALLGQPAPEPLEPETTQEMMLRLTGIDISMSLLLRNGCCCGQGDIRRSAFGGDASAKTRPPLSGICARAARPDLQLVD